MVVRFETVFGVNKFLVWDAARVRDADAVAVASVVSAGYPVRILRIDFV